MLFVNKASVKVFDGQALVLWQLLLCVVALPIIMIVTGECHLGDRSPSLHATLTTLWQWLPKSVLFLCVLQTSTGSLITVNVETLTVFRTLTTLLVALVELTWLRTNISRGARMALVLTVIGAVIYAKEDIHFVFWGYVYVGLNVFSNSAYSLYSKVLVRRSVGGPFEQTFWNNTAAALVLLVIEMARCVHQGQVPSVSRILRVNEFIALPWVNQMIVLASAVVSLFLSWTVTLLTSMISATVR